MSNTQSFDAVITLINDEIKSKSNGKQYLQCEVEFKEGRLAGKKYFAQRTLGENKASVSVGQSVKCILNVVETDGVKRPFFEISTSRVDSAEDIMALLA